MVGGSLRVLRLLPPLFKTGRHDIAEILLKVVLNTINQIKSSIFCCKFCFRRALLRLCYDELTSACDRKLTVITTLPPTTQVYF
jgi:hypothetical protein